MTRRLMLLVPAMLALAGSSPRADVPSSSTPTFRSDTQVVLLDVVVSDGHGRPVLDLKADELLVFEDGQRCRIESMRLVRPRGAAASAGRAATTRPMSAERGRVAQPPPASADAAAPEQGDGADAPSQANLVVLLFEKLSVTTAPTARRGALAFLKQRFPPNTWFSVFKIDTGGTRLLQPFTSDPGRLTAAIQAATLGDDARGDVIESAGLQRLAEPSEPPADTRRAADLAAKSAEAFGRLSQAVQGDLAELSGRVQMYDSVYALLAIARNLAPVRGRKSVVCFGEGREGPDKSDPAYLSLVSAAHRANLTIHTADARGLTATRVGGRSAFDEAIGQLSAASPTGGGRGAIGNTSWTQPTERGDQGGGRMGGSAGPGAGSWLENVAHDTGGLAAINTNDLGAGLAGVAEELSRSYEVVYAPANQVADGRFREIKVKAARPGLRVRTRAGYYATPAGAPTIAAHELPLLAALQKEDPPRAFEHEAGLLQFAPRGREREVVFLARVASADLEGPAATPRSASASRLALLALVRDEAGRTVARLTQERSPDAGADPNVPRRDAVVFQRLLSLPAGRYSVDSAVQDGRGRVSVTRTPVAVAPASASGLAAGSLVIVQAAERAGADAGVSPLTVEGVAIHPRLGTPVLPASTREIPLFLPVFAPAGTRPQLSIELWRGEERIKTLQPPLTAADSAGRIAWVGGLATPALPDGEYEVVATVGEGAEVAESRAAFEIRSRVAGGLGATAPGGGRSQSDAAPTLEKDRTLPEVLQNVGKYVSEYEHAFSNLVAEEDYEQAVGSRQQPTDLNVVTRKRRTRADLVFVRLPGDFPWASYRDVFEVDHRKVRDREQRLLQLFTRPKPDAHEQAREILAASAEYNIGPVTRTVNLPTLPLVFLLPRNQRRFEFRLGERRTIASTEAVELAFVETSRPTLVRGRDDTDLRTGGRFWVHASRGTVLRSEVELDFGRDAEVRVTTDYRPEPALAMWVPAQMTELYANVPPAPGSKWKPKPVFPAPVSSVARYGRFRRFTVSSEAGEPVVQQPPSADRAPGAP